MLQREKPCMQVCCINPVGGLKIRAVLSTLKVQLSSPGTMIAVVVDASSLLKTARERNQRSVGD
jgi:hypothetical protein